MANMFNDNRSVLDKMLLGFNDKNGKIKFKYYGDFSTMERIYDDCKDDLVYIGNSKIDGSPVFIYQYSNINTNDIKDFTVLNRLLRSLKIKHYSKNKLNKKEQSIFTFFKFFMVACDNLELKNVVCNEVVGTMNNYDTE